MTGVESGMRGIGEVARASGLGVSALRFYDQAGVLVPAEVDPATGYRRYGEGQIRAARLVAGLRRVGMPVAEIARAVAELPRPESVRKLLDEHLARLEDGLTDARRELSRLHRLLDGSPEPEEPLMTTVTLPAADLAAALDAVRFAASADPALPMINGILLESTGDGLTLAATDRFRLAVAEVPAAVTGPPVRVLAPLPFADALRPLLEAGEIVLALEATSVTAEGEAGRLAAVPVEAEFPDHRRLGPATGSLRIAVDVPALREAVAAAAPVRREHDGSAYEVVVLALDDAGALRAAAEAEWAADPAAHVAVNREFLLEALDAGGPGQLELQLDGPVKPLALRMPTGYTLLMPVRG
mgnify:CR=1 FL=1